MWSTDWKVYKTNHEPYFSVFLIITQTKILKKE